jgi:lipopolysaccharide export system protein LptA
VPRLPRLLLAALWLLGGAAGVLAQQPPPRPGGLSGHDTGQPIEIVSDRLVVEQDKQLATFIGNVDAVQGDVTLRADLLRVYYTRSEDRTRSESRAAAAGDDQSIRRIEAEGNVLLTSPRETAEGKFGVYDVPQGQVTLEGDVVLTRDQRNVVRGDRLVVDLRTGVSTVTAAGTDAGGGPRQDRVRALFAPAPKEPAPGEPAARQPPKPAARKER